MKTFTNEQVAVTGLPAIEEVKYHPLELPHRTISIVSTTLLFLFLGAGFFIAAYFEPRLLSWPVAPLFSGLWVLIFIFSLLVSFKSYEYEGYAVREHDIIHKQGWIFRSEIIVPFNRVQHCEVNQGPLDRLMGLSTLSVFTAGGSDSDISIPGLKPETAAALKEFITRKAGMDEEE
jgi:membrane protein YdbS with pleckstrin-like domain